MWLAADVPILVTLPDPASIEATYRFVKSAFVRRLRTTRGFDRLIPNPTGPAPAALDIYRAAKLGGVPVEKLTQEIRRYRPTFIVNQTRTVPDIKLGGFIATAARRRLGHTFDYLGHVESDETVWLAARRRRSLVAEYPDGKASRNIERLGRRLLSLDGERERQIPPVLRLEEEQTYYEILETEPGVSDEEIRRAYRDDQGHVRVRIDGGRGPVRGARADRAAHAHQRRARHVVSAGAPAAIRSGAARGRSGARRAARRRRRGGGRPRAAAATSAPTRPRW